MAERFSISFPESQTSTLDLWAEEFGLDRVHVLVAAISLFHIARDLKFGIGDDDRGVVELLDDVIRITKGIGPTGGPGL